jgi:3D-(3,5/4)-trihydroxycyclohexane-1,2-dione acylhydrolase (decyclizing)
VLLDNRGFGCINRLQHASGGERFNNLFDYNVEHQTKHDVDFAAHARSLGAIAEKVDSLADLEAALKRSKGNTRSTVIVINTDPMISTDAGGHWWDVAIPEVSSRKEVQAARRKYEAALKFQRAGD